MNSEEHHNQVRGGVDNIRFPDIFRAVGKTFEPDETGKPVIVDVEQVFYFIGPAPDFAIPDVTYSKATKPDPRDRRGWTIVRHHKTRAQAEGYKRGAHDLGWGWDWGRGGCFVEANGGYFTLVEFDPPVGAVERAFVYKAEGPVIWGSPSTWSLAILDDGSRVTIDDLLPAED